jgi:hypothetical protein
MGVFGVLTQQNNKSQLGTNSFADELSQIKVLAKVTARLHALIAPRLIPFSGL